MQTVGWIILAAIVIYLGISVVFNVYGWGTISAFVGGLSLLYSLIRFC
jgi:hypothetical protein